MANWAVNTPGPRGKFYLQQTESARSGVKGAGLTSKYFCLAKSYQRKSGSDLSERLEHTGSGKILFPWLAHDREENDLEFASH